MLRHPGLVEDRRDSWYVYYRGTAIDIYKILDEEKKHRSAGKHAY